MPSRPTGQHVPATSEARFIRRFRYGADDIVAPPEPDTYPVFLSVRQVLGHIAYGRTTAMAGRPPDAPPYFERWQSKVMAGKPCEPRHYPVFENMHRVVARVRWWQRCKRLSRHSTPSPIRPLNAINRMHLRRLLRRHAGMVTHADHHSTKPISEKIAFGRQLLAQLWRDTRDLYAAAADFQTKIDSAIATLNYEIARDALTAYGRRAERHSGQLASLRIVADSHEVVSAMIFANSVMSVTVGDYIAPRIDIESATVEVSDWEGPIWGHVRFKADEVFRLWKPTGSRQEEQSTISERLPRGDRLEEPPLELPAWFTPMQAVAWIVTRDALIVDRASPERNAIRAYIPNRILPDDKRAVADDPLPAGMTLRWLDAFAAFGWHNEVDIPRPTDSAIAALLRALRQGTAVATALWVGAGERRPMGTDEWAGLVLNCPSRNERVLVPFYPVGTPLGQTPDTRWRDVLIPKAEIMALSPPLPPTDLHKPSLGRARRRWLEAVRTERIRRFKEQQRQHRTWVCFEDIGDWCGRRDNDIVTDPVRIAATYDQLAQSLLAGEFDNLGRTRVLFLSKDSSKARLSREDLITSRRLYPTEVVHSSYLTHCWIPIDAARNWLMSKRQQLPPWMRPIDEGLAGSRPVERPETPTLRTEPSSVKVQNIGQPRKAGRPPVQAFANQLFKDRRAASLPLASTRLQEAEAIVAQWPKDGPPKPLAKTVTEHLRPVWPAERYIAR